MPHTGRAFLKTSFFPLKECWFGVRVRVTELVEPVLVL